MSGLVQIQREDRGPKPAPPIPMHYFRSGQGLHVLVIDGSRVYDVEDETAVEGDAVALFPVSRVPAPPPLRSLSLNLAQACNLRCGYCYADGGSFGGPEARMTEETARRSVDLLVGGAGRGESVVLGFMGGEPLLQRNMLHSTVRYAAEAGARRGVDVRYSITTNGTLIGEEDARLFAGHDFTVQVSLDGTEALHDRQRPSKNGGSAYGRVLRGVEVLNRFGRPRRLSARSTIAHGWDDLREQLDHLLSLGFDEAGFSPVLESATPGLALDAADLRRFLSEMIECGEAAVEHWRRGEAYEFSNLRTALDEIHKGTHRPYPCGAGAGYLSAAADGSLYACHRFVNQREYRMGSVEGVDDGARAAFLAFRHVDSQQPCSSCWARYLCGGGCHHEVLHAGRGACDYVRGWLDFCLRAYVETEGLFQ